MTLNIHDFRWTREPAAFTVSDDKVEIVTKPHMTPKRQIISGVLLAVIAGGYAVYLALAVGEE